MFSPTIFWQKWGGTSLINVFIDFEKGAIILVPSYFPEQYLHLRQKTHAALSWKTKTHLASRKCDPVLLRKSIRREEEPYRDPRITGDLRNSSNRDNGGTAPGKYLKRSYWKSTRSWKNRWTMRRLLDPMFYRVRADEGDDRSNILISE